MSGDSQESGFQVDRDAAEIYEESYVPAIFSEWAPRLTDAAGVAEGQRVLDVGCGTGVVARHAKTIAGGSGRVVGLDLNAGMLAVARRLAPAIEWCRSDAAALPFGDESFDGVLSLAALTFFADRVASLREVRRVLRVGGTAAIQVWGPCPGYDRIADAIEELAGLEASNRFMAPFALAHPAALMPLFGEAGFGSGTARMIEGAVRFPSIDELVRTEIEGSPLAGAVEVEPLIEATREKLAEFRDTDGRVSIPIQGHIVIVVRE